MNDTVLIGEMSCRAYETRIKLPGQVVMVPIGALEQHGPHMSMNPDVLLPSAIAVEVAKRGNYLVAPPIAYGYKSQQRSGGGNHLCGTTSLDGATLTATVRDLIREFARHGARNMCFVNGHYENSMFAVEGIDLALRELRAAGVADIQVVMLSYWDFVTDAVIGKLYPDGFTGWAVEHGGVLETSLMLYLHPNLVDMDYVPLHPPAQFPPYDIFPPISSWTPSSGCLSSAKNASAEKGQILFDVCADGISVALSEAFLKRK